MIIVLITHKNKEGGCNLLEVMVIQMASTVGMVSLVVYT